jgi:DNA-directed RNA polymerase specialized sigma24 family protein
VKAKQDSSCDDRRTDRGIEDHLDAMDPCIRAALVMRLQGELSYAEIAEALGEDVVTLRVRVRRALLALRRCLEAKGIEL